MNGLDFKTIGDIWTVLEDLEKEDVFSVTVVNQIKVFKYELKHALMYCSKHKCLRSWVKLVQRHLLRLITIGRMPVDILEETMSSLLQIIDDCPTIDNIYKCLGELENQGDLTMHVENQILNLKFELRNVRIHLKWRTFPYPILFSLRSWVKDAEGCLLQPRRKGCMTGDLLENALSSLLCARVGLSGDNIQWFDEFPLNFDCKTNAIIDDILEWIDPLLYDLKHPIRSNEHTSVVFAKEQIETMAEKLEFLRNFLEIVGMELQDVIKNGEKLSGPFHKKLGNLLARIKRLIHDAIYVFWFPWGDGEHQWMDERLIQNAIHVSWFSWGDGEYRLMDKLFLIFLASIDHIEPEIRMTYVQLLKASKIASLGTLGIDLQALAAVDSLLDNLLKLQKDQDTSSLLHLDSNQIEILCQELFFLKYFLMDPHVKQDNETEAHSINSLLIQVEAMARELGASLTLSVCVGRTDYLASEMHLLYPNLLKIISILKIKITGMFLNIPRQSTSNFPRCPNLGFVNFFIQSLEELLQHRADSIAYVKNEVGTLQSELTLLNSFIRDSTNNLEENEIIASRTTDVAYEAEHVIGLISASHFPKWYHILQLSDVIEKIKILRKDCLEVHSKLTSEMKNVEKASSTNNPGQAYNLATEKEMVGFQAEAKKIIDQLTVGTKQLAIVSIVGMPGLGKTTLANKVYEYPSITNYFHVRSWYCISQVYDRQDLLRSILSDVPQRLPKRDNEEMDEVLYRSLKGMRYLIVLDDIWSIEPWNDIRNSFPDDYNGSRILITSRIREVGLQLNPRFAPHDLRLFSDEESWTLLQNKVFKQRSYSPEIYRIGKKIAENCKGLPLSVVLVAGVLVKLDENEDQWKQVLASLSKQVGDLSKCILELSYKHLPNHLKPCFLYFGAFPEDKVIPTWKLFRLWVSEGFIQKTNDESLEKVAEGYLMDLIARSLVIIAQSKSIGGVKSCLVHDLLHEFSMEKAKDENFLRISKEMPCDLEQYRHCFYYNRKSLCGWTPYDPYVRSIYLFPSIDRRTSFRDGPLLLLYSLKLLRVLDLQCIPISNHQLRRLTEVLVHLRYLAIQASVDQVPSSVANLWRLETFIFKGTNGKVKLPEALLEMAYLKHVYVYNSAVFEFSNHPEKSNKSDSIEKLSTLRVDDCTLDNVMKSLRSLRKLKCIFSETWYQNRDCRQFPMLDFLSELESLNMEYRPFSKNTLSEFSFPSNLKKLTLSGLRLPWSKISKIGRLPQLKVLKLLSDAFMGQRWDASDDEFYNLKFLKLEGLDIKEWHASPDAFPCIEQLVLKDCHLLQEIPSSFGESSTLQMVEVKRCRNSVTEVVLKIKDEQQNLGTVGFKVLIQHFFSQQDLDIESDSNVN